MWIRRFPILLLVFGVNACDECTWGSCDYFPCPASRPYVAAVGHDRRVTPCWDHPFEHSEAVYSAVSEDTSIVTAAIDGFDVILTGVGEGKADVELTATVPFREDSATVVYHVASVLPWIGEITTCDAEEREGYTDIEIEAPDARPAMANLLIMSKRMVVRPEYRGRNIGFRLKMAQRDLALKQAIRLVTWTVDPLLAANAHFNIRKLGAVVQRYAPARPAVALVLPPAPHPHSPRRHLPRPQATGRGQRGPPIRLPRLLGPDLANHLPP